MNNIQIRDVTDADFVHIVTLNQAEVAHTSPMNRADIAKLHDFSAYHRVIIVDDVIAGFLLVMGPKSRYINENYGWFKKHYDDFMYIDRIVLAIHYQGKQLGHALYRDLFLFAQQHGCQHVVCEYNVVPSNIPSAKFHQRLGFVEVGTQWLPVGNVATSHDKTNTAPVLQVENHGGQKKVSMQCCQLVSQ
ncbi:GNAT family N-acetyltransferase [Paraglaciecola sp. L1A13]|uniref:GNAT family N-acetyltransferase n=1 Tax=Paraglaciecola sp. L1A13 TaxID=2686359 RepID=UPI00131B5F9F|nr:GNAT family N-acetyltransferase [Paraglaciecola sp. L1A13]